MEFLTPYQGTEFIILEGKKLKKTFLIATTAIIFGSAGPPILEATGSLEKSRTEEASSPRETLRNGQIVSVTLLVRGMLKSRSGAT